jgi:hypothetical protein
MFAVSLGAPIVRPGHVKSMLAHVSPGDGNTEREPFFFFFKRALM